ncbi:hypothetical protein BDA99DRAFT_430220 [Phascolomyces articulosus]|uniref:Arrestin C-terminal-like domain-containing protein n=1 Tax=Phascolomyces articulosus TaxID=60185 RepID=A0AAD5KPX6_9FUNG|nr:hypothetical protein BDA99DRAFT_430220 [Phascolomyces articulosus]
MLSTPDTERLLRIDLENDQLVMYGSTTDSTGCVLRGVVSLNLSQPTKVKAITLKFSGNIIKRQVVRTHTFDFELPLPGHLPESTRVGNIYIVQYTLKATVERPLLFHRNYTRRRTIHVSRRPEEEEAWRMMPDFTLDQHPVAIADQWSDKLSYAFTAPSKTVPQGGQVQVSATIAALSDHIQIRYLSCYLKEYMSCRNPATLFENNDYHRPPKPRTHSRIIYYTQVKNNFDDIQLTFPVPTSPDDCQIDCLNEQVKIRHRLKFALSVMNRDGNVSELRVMMPIKVCPANEIQHDYLPAYDDQTSSIPYDPVAMIALLRNRQSSCHLSLALPDYSAIAQRPPVLPTYEESR